ncbi:hypothetical protein [Mesorhizobium sp.]|uniref:hypothetical protein n=1 Tax=Mesorhizobium sp. TaxID=1871066 RepID=UPI0025E02ECD|nr:hypothetical protein [Mesorhizobium sp.]
MDADFVVSPVDPWPCKTPSMRGLVAFVPLLATLAVVIAAKTINAYPMVCFMVQSFCRKRAFERSATTDYRVEFTGTFPRIYIFVILMRSRG